MDVDAFVYLAVPYSHPSREVRVARFRAANRAAARLMALGEIVFSPISHTHSIAEQCGLPQEWDYWWRFDEAFLRRSRKVYVLMLDGYDESLGIAGELKIANELGLPVEFLPAEFGDKEGLHDHENDQTEQDD